MSKVTLTTVSGTGSIQTFANNVNNNSQAIEEAFDNTLSRDGTSPNEMNVNLDMNSYQIINLPEPSTDQSPLRRGDIKDTVEGYVGGVVHLSFTRSDIPNKIIPVDAFAVSGFSDIGDLGTGAIYVRGTETGPMAIADKSGAWWNLYTSNGVRAGWCGVKADGVTDDTAAFRLAWDIACNTSKVLYLETGTMRIATATQPFNSVSGLTVIGSGPNTSIVKWVEGSLVLLFGRIYSQLGRVSNVTYKDFAVIGTHGDDGDYTTSSTYPFLSYGVDGLLHQNIRVEKSRVMGMAARGCTNVRAVDCQLRYCARDGINFADCDDARFEDNLLEFIDDDAIAWHNDTAGRIDRRCNIVNNTIRFSQGIKALGMVTGSITGNTLEFCIAQGIAVNTETTGVEGRNAANGISITGNTIKNCIDRAAVDGLNSNAPYIYVGGRSAQAGGLSAIPGENVTGTASVINPDPYWSGNDGGATTDPVPGSQSITVAGNTLCRDIPWGVSLSSLGYGIFYTRNGPVDIASITEANVRQVGIQIDGIVKNLNIGVNTFDGLGYAIFLNGGKVNGRAVGNKIFNCSIGIACAGTSHHDFVSQGNEYDLDPYLNHAGRGANGTWTSASAGPLAFWLQNNYGITSRGDIFRNMSRISDEAMNAAAGSSTKLYVEQALLRCHPAATSFSTLSKGIGECPRASSTGFWYEIWDSDPASSTYLQVLNYCGRQASSIPTSGTYVFGMFVHNTGPTISAGKVLLGWIRLTNGSSHTSGTDWTPVYGTTS